MYYATYVPIQVQSNNIYMFISQKSIVWEISHLEDLIFVRLKGVQFEFQVPQVPEGNSLRGTEQLHIQSTCTTNSTRNASVHIDV